MDAVTRLNIVPIRLRFHLVPGLGLGVITVHRVCPEVVTTGGETVPLIEIGCPVSDRGLRVLQRRTAALAAYAGLDTPTLAQLAEYRSRITSAPVRWVDR